MGESEAPKKGLYLGGERPASKSEHQWKVLCLDLTTGKLQWEKTVHRGAPPTAIHLKNSYGAETPVTDGERVYALFGNVGVFAFTVDGKEAWSKRLELRIRVVGVLSREAREVLRDAGTGRRMARGAGRDAVGRIAG